MSDYTLEQTQYIPFTTRAFGAGIPTTLAGTPVVSAYEDAGLTQITAGITLSVDHDSVAGFNMVSVAATAANGFEVGKTYSLVVTTGTVGGVSVVGEVVGYFTVQRSAAYAEAGVIISALETVDSNVDAILVDTAEIGAAGAGLTALASASNLALVAGYLDTEIAAILEDTGTTLPGLISALNNLSAADVNAEVDTALADYDGPTKAEMDSGFTEIKGATFSGATDSLEAIRDRGDAEWVTGGGGSAPTVEEIRAEMDGNSTKLAAILVDTGTDIPALLSTIAGYIDTEVQAIKDVTDLLPNAGALTSIATAASIAALNNFDPAAETVNIGKINGSAEAAADLALSAATIVSGAAATGTLSTTQMTTDLAEATDDHYNGRIIIWTSGVLKDQATNITDYAGSGGLLTFTAVTEAPSDSDTFVIV